MIDISECIIDFFIFSLAFLCSGIGLFIFSLCIYAFRELISNTITHIKGD